MEWYRYDEITKEYLYPVQCQRDPLNPDQFLPMANATPDKPPERQQGFAVVWDGAIWTLQEDHRGKTVYNRTDKSEMEIKDIGVVPDTHTLDKPTEFDHWSTDGWKADLDLQHKTLTDRFLQQLDQKASEVRSQVLSGGDNTAEEYRRAETVAKAFKSGNYEGTVPKSIQTHMDVYRVDAVTATETILGKATAMADRLDVIRDYRLKGKAKLKFLSAESTADDFQATFEHWFKQLEGISKEKAT